MKWVYLNLENSDSHNKVNTTKLGRKKKRNQGDSNPESRQNSDQKAVNVTRILITPRTSSQ